MRVSRWRGVSILILSGLMLALSLAPVVARALPDLSGPESVAEACRELIADGGFEQGGQGWTQLPSPPNRQLISNFYPRPSGGQSSADLSGQNNTLDQLSQTVTLPVDVNEIVLRYWWAFQTEEPDLSYPFDRLTVQLYRPDGTPVATLVNTDYTGLVDWVWNPVSRNLTQYRGQTLVLRFTTETDNTNPTRFFVDDISIQGCVRRLVYLPMIRR